MDNDLLTLAMAAAEKGNLLKEATITYKLDWGTGTPDTPTDTTTPVTKSLTKTFSNGTIAKLDTAYQSASKTLTATLTLSNWIAGTFNHIRMQAITGESTQKNINNMDTPPISAFSANGTYSFSVSAYLAAQNPAVAMDTVTGMRVRATKTADGTFEDGNLDFR